MKLVKERNESWDDSVGPYGSERIGIEHDGRVIWLGCIGYGHSKEAEAQYQADKAFATQLVERWHACRNTWPEKFTT